MSERTVTVYSSPGFCGMCLATKRALDSAGIAYTEVDLATVSQDQINTWKATLGQHAPIVTTPTDSWSGFRPDRIAALASEGDQD